GNFYLTFYILGNAMVFKRDLEGNILQESPFGENDAGFWIFTIARYIYILLIVAQFIMSMGNRPQGSNWAYKSSMGFFAVLMGYMLFGAGYMTVAGINQAREDAEADGGGTSITSLYFQNAMFRNTVVSLASTYGLYFFASFLFLEPWHMFHSFIQYMFMVPSYVNILNVYAFCNIHDISWGTKGDTSVNTDLGVAKKTSEGGVEVAMPTDSHDINNAYDEAVSSLSIKTPEVKQERSVKEKQEDYYREIRTRVLLAWIMSNAFLVALVTSAAFGDFTRNSTTYLGIVLWSVAGLAFFRFVGSVTYMILRLFNGRIV
ncbi:Chitin synthase, class 1, partial [Lobosporangium transversale]